MKCENCNEDHDGKYSSGRFCSSHCSRSFSAKSGSENHKKVNCCDCGRELTVNIHSAVKGVRCVECRTTMEDERRGRKKRVYNKREGYLPTTNCLSCGKKIRIGITGYCKHCYRRNVHNVWIDGWLNGSIDGNLPGGHIPMPIRNYLFEQNENRCSRCGWGEINITTGKIPLEINHVDGDHNNNRPNNLELICPNCHSLTPTYRALNKGNGRNRKNA